MMVRPVLVMGSVPAPTAVRERADIVKPGSGRLAHANSTTGSWRAHFVEARPTTSLRRPGDVGAAQRPHNLRLIHRRSILFDLGVVNTSLNQQTSPTPMIQAGTLSHFAAHSTAPASTNTVPTVQKNGTTTEVTCSVRKGRQHLLGDCPHGGLRGERDGARTRELLSAAQRRQALPSEPPALRRSPRLWALRRRHPSITGPGVLLASELRRPSAISARAVERTLRHVDVPVSQGYVFHEGAPAV